MGNPVDDALRERQEALDRGEDISSLVPEDEMVLDLSELAPERPPFRLRWDDKPDGEIFHLAVMGDFGIEEQQQLTREGAEFDRLWNSSDLNLDQKQRLKQLLDQMFSRVTHDLPAEVAAKVNDDHRSQIVMAFTLAPLAAAARREQAKKETEAKAAEKGQSITES